MAKLSGVVSRSIADTRAAVVTAAAEQNWEIAKSSDADHVRLFVETTGFVYGSQMTVLLQSIASGDTRIEIETHRTAPSFGNIGRGRLAARRMLRAVGAS